MPNNHVLTQNLYYNYYYPNPKYQIIGYMDPLGNIVTAVVYRDCAGVWLVTPTTYRLGISSNSPYNPEKCVQSRSQLVRATGMSSLSAPGTTQDGNTIFLGFRVQGLRFRV